MGCNNPITPFRYDLFTIWGNGLQYSDKIINILNNEKWLEIVCIEKHYINKMPRFVYQFYACDTVPLEHLKSKLQYLNYVKPEILMIYAINHEPHEQPTGAGDFRKVQCQNINRIKWHIRELFNPRANGKRSEEHIIHASDYEEQVDYCLKLLGHKRGIYFLHNCDTTPLFYKPYHINAPKEYVFIRIDISQLKASIIVNNNSGKAAKSLMKIDQTPHYQSLRNGEYIYKNYLSKYRYILLKDNYSWERFYRMNQLSKQEINNFDPIIVVSENDDYRVLDGVHRAAITAFHGFKQIRCVEVLSW